jgi:hypothetical protein
MRGNQVPDTHSPFSVGCFAYGSGPEHGPRLNVTVVPAGRLVLFGVAGAVDFCLLPDPSTLLNPALDEDEVEDELRAVARSMMEGCIPGRGWAAPTPPAVGDLVRDGAVATPG